MLHGISSSKIGNVEVILMIHICDSSEYTNHICIMLISYQLAPYFSLIYNGISSTKIGNVEIILMAHYMIVQIISNHIWIILVFYYIGTTSFRNIQ